jgi:hypothetical protein
MSDVPVETGAPAEEVAPDIGQGEPEAAPPSYLETDQYADHHVRVKVDGQEVSVPLREAIDGYSRQADYTRKTQELAEQQRRAQFGLTLQQALEANPQETLRILQAQYLQEQAEQAPPTPPPDWTDDPTDKRWQEYDARLQRFEQQQADNELRQAVGVLQQRYGDDFNPTEVVQAAFAQGRMDLEAVYKEMAFDRYWQGQQAAQQSRAAEEAARVDAKSQAANTVHTGNGSANAAPPPNTSFPTIEEAFADAKRQHGLV